MIEKALSIKDALQMKNILIKNTLIKNPISKRIIWWWSMLSL